MKISNGNNNALRVSQVSQMPKMDKNRNKKETPEKQKHGGGSFSTFREAYENQLNKKI